MTISSGVFSSNWCHSIQQLAARHCIGEQGTVDLNSVSYILQDVFFICWFINHLLPYVTQTTDFRFQTHLLSYPTSNNHKVSVITWYRSKELSKKYPREMKDSLRFDGPIMKIKTLKTDTITQIGKARARKRIIRLFQGLDTIHPSNSFIHIPINITFWWPLIKILDNLIKYVIIILCLRG